MPPHPNNLLPRPQRQSVSSASANFFDQSAIIAELCRPPYKLEKDSEGMVLKSPLSAHARTS
jgi:hypothetical protein